MEHIKDSIKEYGINNWIECDMCEHMFHPDRISSIPCDIKSICDECN